MSRPNARRTSIHETVPVSDTPRLSSPGARLTDAGDLSAALARAESQAANLEIALASNRTIGVAIGLVMATYRLSQDTAFSLMLRLSQESNTKVGVLAERMIEGHLADLETR